MIKNPHMHNPEGLGVGDFIDWKAVRKTEEYRKHILRHLKAILEDRGHAPDYEERFKRAAEVEPDNLDSMGSLEEFLESGNGDFRTKEEQDSDARISDLESVEEIEEYVRENRIDFDVQEEIKKLETTYLEDQRHLEDLNDKYRGVVKKMVELMSGEKPQDPDVQ